MHQTRSFNPFTAALFAATTLVPTFIASSGAAQEACGESTCDKGYHCEELMAPCPLILCVEGEECEPCQSETIEACVPSECESDADCSDYMVCGTFDTLECPQQTPTCEEGETEDECSAKWDAYNDQCVEGEVQQCSPKHYQSCSEAADCGDGFECVPYGCACASAGSSEDAAQSGTRIAPDEECVCPEEEEGYCSAVETACETDSDCLDHWTCGENYNYGCFETSDGEVECETPDPAMVCYPPEPGGNQLVSLAASTGGVTPDLATGLPEMAADGRGESTNGAAGDEADGAESGDPDVMDLPASNETQSPADLEEAEVETSNSEEAAENTAANDGNDVALDAAPGNESGASGCAIGTIPASQSTNWSALVAGLGLALSVLRRRSR